MRSIDIYTQCGEFSSSVMLSFQDILDQSVELGYDMVMVAQHNKMEISEGTKVNQKNQRIDEKLITSFEKKAVEEGVMLIFGCEISTQVGDFLIISTNKNRSFNLPTSISFDHALHCGLFDKGNAVIWLHPKRGGERSTFEDSLSFGLDKIMRVVTAIQTLNGRDLLTAPQYNDQAMKLANKYGKPSVGGTEALKLSSLGLVDTVFSGEINTQQDVINAINRGETSPKVNHDILGNTLQSFALQFAS